MQTENKAMKVMQWQQQIWKQKGGERKGKGLSLVSERFHLFTLMKTLHLKKDQHSKQFDLPPDETSILMTFQAT
jgi:hypothetical protein